MTIESGRNYKLKNVKSGTVLDKSGTDGVSIIGWQDHGTDNQKWHVERDDSGWTLRNVESGQYLAIVRGLGEPGDGTPLVASQEKTHWDIWPDEKDQSTYRIFVHGARNPINIDLGDHGNPNNGTPVTLWGKWAGLNQTWRFEEV